MCLEIILVLVQLIICNQYYFVTTHPMFGQNVRSAEANEFPFVVCITRIDPEVGNWEENFICSGVLVTKQDILTVAHCSDGEEIDKIVVHVGSNDIRKANLYYPLWWITYNQWATYMNIKQPHRVNDIANLRLRKNVTHNFNPPALSSLNNEELYDKDIIVAAWGVNIKGRISPIMKTVTLRVLTKTDCRSRVNRLHGTKVIIHKRHICSYADPPAVMHFGDSGGPLLHMGKLVGVHKATIPFPDEPLNFEKINIHTSIDYYRDFVGDSGGPILYNGMIIAIHKATIPFPGELLNPRKINLHTTINYYREFILNAINSNFNF